MGYSTDIRHFLNEDGVIPDELPEPARELDSFTALIIDAVTCWNPNPTMGIETGLPCRTSTCDGEIIGLFEATDLPLYWHCPECEMYGTITGWQDTKWDNRSS